MKSTARLAILGCLLFSHFQLSAQVLDLADALKKGWLTAAASSAGGQDGESLQVTLLNKTKKKLDVLVPAGQVFQAGDSTQQDLMVGKEALVSLESGKAQVARLFGFCIEADDGSPGDGSEYGVGRLAEGALLKLAQHLSRNNLHQHPGAQGAVWAVSDNRTLAGIGDPALTKFTADLLGKPVPEYRVNYQPPQEAAPAFGGVGGHHPPHEQSRPEGSGQALLDHQPADNRQAASLDGIFYYELPKDQKVTFGLYDAQGNSQHLVFSDRVQKRGYHKFRFGFEIWELPKGKYFARLTSEGKTVKEMEVEF